MEEEERDPDINGGGYRGGGRAGARSYDYIDV